MQYDFNFYSSLLLITFSQGLIYSILILKKGIQTENKSNYWLSIFVFLCSLYVAPWMLGFAGWYDHQPYRNFMFYMPFQQLFFIGPILFFYIQSLLNPAFRLNKKQFSHLIPGVLYQIYIFFIFIFDKFISKKPFFYANGMDKDFDSWYQYSGFISMLIYLILSLKYYNKYRKLVVQITSNADAVLFSWIRKYLIAFLGMLLLKVFTEMFFAIFPEYTNYVGGWWFYLIFSLILYYIAITGYTNGTQSKIGFKMSGLDQNPIQLINENSLISSQEINLDYKKCRSEISPEIDSWKTKIENLILTERLFQNPELSLTEIAKKLESNSNIISRAINQGFNMNFNDFINNYRIEAVKEMFKKGEHKNSTLIGIAYDCGFNSKATFNRAFKKNTNVSPKEFLSQN
jgi:AraC-like DNA-binding protein